MKQILQNLGNGETLLAEAPCPAVGEGEVLIASRCSLVSAGTERMLVNFGRANLLQKAKQQPDKVLQVLQKIKSDGLRATVDAVRSRLDQPLPLGYCNAGVVLESRAAGFKAGDRVISNGGHAEVVAVPANLCAHIPDAVEDEAACFTVLAAVGLQGIRLLQPTLGEGFVVTGLGLIGLMCVRILRAHGCRVLGIDPDPARCALARGFGAEIVDLSSGTSPLTAASTFSAGRGVDGVLITASGKSDEIVHQAAQMCRQRGRIVLVGVVGLNLRRDDFYKKELTFQVSCSYGPGRYDPAYEVKGRDYPFGFVRWTAQRNFEAVLELMHDGWLDVTPLISDRISFAKALTAYAQLDSRNTLGIVLQYPPQEAQALLRYTLPLSVTEYSGKAEGKACLAVIGAGNYASRILIPAFQQTGAVLDTLVSARGMTAAHHGGKMGFAKAASDIETVLADDSINTVVIATRHHLHAGQVVAALEAGKHVFVEKPLCLTLDELKKVESVYSSLLTPHASPPLLMIGFNRRFAPLLVRMKRLREQCPEPVALLMTMNAGAIPADHWTQDQGIGGGRIIGEACHYIDLARFLVGAPIVEYQTIAMGGAQGTLGDKALIQLRFGEGSMASIHYLANGGKRFPKERIELFGQDAVLQLDNFRQLRGFGWPGFSSQRQRNQDKGQRACTRAFVQAVEQGGKAPITPSDIFEVSEISIRIAQQLRGAQNG